MKRLDLIELPVGSRRDREADSERKRTDIFERQAYLVRYDRQWLLGEFTMYWYGWSFHPNLGVMSMQIECLSEIFEVPGLGRRPRHPLPTERHPEVAVGEEE